MAQSRCGWCDCNTDHMAVCFPLTCARRTRSGPAKRRAQEDVVASLQSANDGLPLVKKSRSDGDAAGADAHPTARAGEMDAEPKVPVPHYPTRSTAALIHILTICWCRCCQSLLTWMYLRALLSLRCRCVSSGALVPESANHPPLPRTQHHPTAPPVPPSPMPQRMTSTPPPPPKQKGSVVNGRNHARQVRQWEDS